MMRPSPAVSQRRNRRPQNVKHTIQIEIKHALERRIVGLDDRLAAREATDCVRQDVQLSETRHNLIYEGSERPHGSKSLLVAR